MKWVTWENVGVDRIGSAWLIRKFIDPKARFIFMPQGHEPLPKGAEPFDIPGVRYSHHQGHCTFHTLLNEFKLTDPIRWRIARIVDEADTVQQVALEPAAPGLDLICSGIRLTCTSDEEALERGGLIYDALYAQLAALLRKPGMSGHSCPSIDVARQREQPGPDKAAATTTQ